MTCDTMIRQTYFSLVVTLTVFSSCKAGSKPNIVFVVADDMGHADIGYNNPYMKTPFLDELARTGVTLTQSYVQPLCTASRNAFLTGRYPFKTGLQHLAILPDEPACLPYDIKILPQYLKEQGYSTHMVGKWHLGLCNQKCIPTQRGFDSFYGVYNGMFDYFTHEIQGYLDFRDNKEPVWNRNGTYATTLFTDRAVKIIDNHNPEDPLFLYLPYTSPHIPLQAPKEYEDRCRNIKDATRRTFCGMVAALDDGVGRVTKALKDNDLYDNTIIVFTTDNGGWVSQSGNNWPLRGQKSTIFEGGTKGPAFIHSPLLKRSGYVSNEMIHAVDWLSTFISLSGGSPPEGVDSIDQTAMVMRGGESLRTEFIYNLDNYSSILNAGRAGIRVGDYKLMVGSAGSFRDGWFVPPEYEQDMGGKRSALRFKGMKNRNNLNTNIDSEMQQTDNIEFPFPRKRLFNLKFDPEERDNLADKLPEVVARLEARLEGYKEMQVNPIWPATTPDEANPENFGNVWSPGWC